MYAFLTLATAIAAVLNKWIDDPEIDAIVSLLTEDAWVTMPPQPYEYQGHAAIAAFLSDRAPRRGDRAFRLVATRANGQPAYGVYLRAADGSAHGVGLHVLTLSGDRVSEMVRFESHVLPWFALPPSLERVTRRG